MTARMVESWLENVSRLRLSAIDQLLTCMRDRSTANNTVVKTLKIVYPHLIDIGCFSHTTDHVGEHFVTPNLSGFMTRWINLFSHSSNKNDAERIN